MSDATSPIPPTTTPTVQPRVELYQDANFMWRIRGQVAHTAERGLSFEKREEALDFIADCGYTL